MNPQPELFLQPSDGTAVLNSAIACVKKIITANRQPSAAELLRELEKSCGWFARHVFSDAVEMLRDDRSLSGAQRAYLANTLHNDSLIEALRAGTKPNPRDKSILDELFLASITYRDSAAFKEALEFCACFRDYAPFNNMLVHVQNPACSFYATARDWEKRFGRQVKEDENPMLILAPMRPVMLVYDLDQTEGPDLPEQIRNFATAVGVLDPRRLDHTIENARRFGIQVQFKRLSSTNGGFATTQRRDASRFKMRIVIHDDLDDQAKYAVLCHEIAHILLGHLGTDHDQWWPCRLDLSHATVEIEAESVAYMVTARIGLQTASAAYLATHAKDGRIPAAVSLDLITKVAGKITEMGDGLLSQPKKKPVSKKSPGNYPKLR